MGKCRKLYEKKPSLDGRRGDGSAGGCQLVEQEKTRL